MEKELNIAAILKDKPVGLKFYSPTFGCVTFNGVHKDKVYFFSKDTNAHSVKQNGKMYDDGECIIFPSNEMRDWSRFAWKKGDVLIGDCGFMCIFKEWASDDYTKFNGCYFDGMPNAETAKYSKLDNNTAYGYIREIENRCGGKLNLETLEIEKQSEFKDGDIVFMREVKSEFSANCIFILRGEYNGEEKALYHAFYNADDKFVYAEYGSTRVHYNLRPATDSEKQQLFEALAKEGKAWDAEKKMLVDLKPEVELKPFDKVLVKDNPYGSWEPALFWKKVDTIDLHPYMVIGGKRYRFCEPYEGNESLLGTTKDVEE